jgi:hypothetical protein
MSKAQRFFRYLWRVNAVLILVAAGAIAFAVGTLLVAEFGARSARRRVADAGPLVAGSESDPRLVLGSASVVAGTEFMRAELVLHRGGAGFSSGGYAEIRNVLFIEPGEKAGRWLLPDDDHVIAESFDLVTNEDDPKTKRTVATVALVKPSTGTPEAATGKLLLFDPSGRSVVEVADGVRESHVALLSGRELTILYERERRLILATFEPGSLTKRGEHTIDVPPLK